MPVPWEGAYLRFETPEQEVRKFRRRLERLGARSWPRDARILELCCGRGNGLRALAELGFERLEGIDLSPRLVALHGGSARCVVGDCRWLPHGSGAFDVVIVQGGLHHLLELPRDLELTLAEASRVLRPAGRFVAVEPWLTPFLRAVHAVASSAVARKCSDKLDAFQTMVEHERATYERWLGAPEPIRALLEHHFEVERCSLRWGKLTFVGRRRGERRIRTGAS